MGLPEDRAVVSPLDPAAVVAAARVPEEAAAVPVAAAMAEVAAVVVVVAAEVAVVVAEVAVVAAVVADNVTASPAQRSTIVVMTEPSASSS